MFSLLPLSLPYLNWISQYSLLNLRFSFSSSDLLCSIFPAFTSLSLVTVILDSFFLFSLHTRRDGKPGVRRDRHRKDEGSQTDSEMATGRCRHTDRHAHMRVRAHTNTHTQGGRNRDRETQSD